FGAFLAAAALPWNPALWWQLRRLRLAVEVDCDARVLGLLPDRARYGHLLLAVGARASARPFAAAALTEPRSFLEERIRAMTMPKPSRPALRAGALGVFSLALVALACEAPRPTEPVSPAMRGAQLAEREAARQAGQAEPRPGPATTGRITGVVTDAETGQPLAGVRVWLGESGRGTITQNNGRYFIINVPAGAHEMGFRTEGYATVMKKNVTLEGDVTRTVDAELPLQR
ncbi:MAG TPA: carboxypeptidase regulatory-like domain-containing protein, partial [Longimicrobiales bacterium]|nr:carboxypeptidase regulatory-like domain-containing protein [Longimicrobiales bacterium]